MKTRRIVYLVLATIITFSSLTLSDARADYPIVKTLTGSLLPFAQGNSILGETLITTVLERIIPSMAVSATGGIFGLYSRQNHVPISYYQISQLFPMLDRELAYPLSPLDIKLAILENRSGVIMQHIVALNIITDIMNGFGTIETAIGQAKNIKDKEGAADFAYAGIIDSMTRFLGTVSKITVGKNGEGFEIDKATGAKANSLDAARLMLETLTNSITPQNAQEVGHWVVTHDIEHSQFLNYALEHPDWIPEEYQTIVDFLTKMNGRLAAHVAAARSGENDSTGKVLIVAYERLAKIVYYFVSANMKGQSDKECAALYGFLQQIGQAFNTTDNPDMPMNDWLAQQRMNIPGGPGAVFTDFD